MSLRNDRALAVLLFVGLWLLYNLNLNVTVTVDTEPAKVIPLGLLLHGTVKLDPFLAVYHEGLWSGEPWFAVRTASGAFSRYPLVTPLLVTPLYVPLALFIKQSELPLNDPRVLWWLALHAKLAASLLTALSAGALYLLARRWLERREALLLTLTYALASSTWTTSSQSLWQHGTSSLLMLASLLWSQRPTGLSLAASGGAAALAFCNRPPNALFAGLLALYVVHAYGRRAWPFLVSLPFVVGPCLAYNQAAFHHPLGPMTTGSQWTTPPLEGLAGLLVGPSRGLVIYSPWVLASGWGVLRIWTTSRYPLLLRYVSLVAILELLVYSHWWCWWGGGCFGPRLLSDLNGLWALLLIPVLVERPGSRLLQALIGYSVAVQLVGVVLWHPPLDSGEQQWSWKESQLAQALQTRRLAPAALGPVPPGPAPLFVGGPEDGALDVGTPGARASLQSGFSLDERDGDVTFAWAQAPIAVVPLRCRQAGRYTLTLRALAPPEIAPVTVSVDVGQRPAGSFRARSGWNVYELTLDDVPAGPLELRLRFDKSFVPGSSDLRKLSLAVDYLELGTPAPPRKPSAGHEQPAR